MKNSQKIQLFFLWLAIGVLLGHHIIPHRHHFEFGVGEDLCETLIMDNHDRNISYHANEICSHGENNHQHCEECHFRPHIPDQKLKRTFHTSFVVSEFNFLILINSNNKKLRDIQNYPYNLNNEKLLPGRAPPFFG